MRGRRLLILIGLIIIVAGIAAIPLLSRILTKPSEPAPSEEVPPQGETVALVVSVQDIPQGKEITEDAVVVQGWPVDAVPVGAIRDMEDVIGKVARAFIPRGMPILESMLAKPGELLPTGGPAAMQIPEGKVAYALPVARYSSVAWALRPGDHVDVLLSFSLVDLDEEFQTVLPNNQTCVSPPEGEECKSGVQGRLEALPNGWLVSITPSEAQRPRLVTQLTVQDAVVLRIGDWREEEAMAEGQAEEGVQPPPEQPLTLAVTRQEAAILEFARLSNMRITLVLRRTGETGQVPGAYPVTLQYLMDTYGIEAPPKLPYGAIPPFSGGVEGPVE
ncbi:MAG TPA: Flp pilus assembly protein CpaB [Anaerolineae bacterium]|nr:Flp pilus assembly protein CpaB [Anaerolineae bacterium]